MRPTRSLVLAALLALLPGLATAQTAPLARRDLVVRLRPVGGA